MNRRLLPLNSLRAFEATGAHLSFTKAAESLGVTQSAISRHVINLEDILGEKLFERRPQGLELTDQGKALLPAVTQAFDGLERALNDLVVEQEVMQLKVAFPPTFAQYGAVPLLTRFQEENADIIIHLQTPRTPGDLRRENLDLAVVYTAPLVTEYVMDLMWQENITPLCHPDLVEGADLSDPQAFLEQQELVNIRVASDMYLTWENWLRWNEMPINSHSGSVFDTAHLAASYAMNGRGVFLSDPVLFERQIKEGRLVAPLPQLTRKSGYGYYLQCRPEDMNHPAIQRLRDWLIEEFSR